MHTNKIDFNELSGKLPEVPGILGKSNYFNSAVLIPFVEINNEYHLLFEKRAKGIRQGSEICFPGGEYDPQIDASFKDTAIRETVEELGIEENRISIIGLLDTLVGPMGVTVDPVVGRLHAENINNLPFDKNEVEKIFTVPISFFANEKHEVYYLRTEVQPEYIDEYGVKKILFPTKELGLPEVYWKPWHTRGQKIIVYRTNEGVIWGITARLIEELIRVINS